MKKLPLVFGLFVAAVLVVVAALLLDSDTQDESVVLGGPDPTASQPATPGLLPVAANGERTAMQVAAPVVAVAVVETPPVDAIPESYRRALGGLVGRVVETSGEPVPDMRVAIAGGGATTFLFPRDGLRASDLALPELILGEARTDAVGRFRIDGLETRVLGAVLVDPGGPRAFFTVLEQVPESGAVRDLGDIVLPACVTLTGVVVDERDAPLPGVRVRAPNIPSMALGFGVEDFRAGCSILVDDDSLDQPFVFVPPREVERYEKLLPFPTTFTDAEGRFTLPGVQPGLPSLVLDDGVHLASVLGPIPTGAAGSTKDMGRIPMPDGESLVVRVLDDQNEPVAGASVMVGSRLKVGPVAILKGPFTTAADGRVEVGGLRASLASGAARTDARQAWAPSTESVSAGTGQELTIVLPGLRTATLVVRDPDGRAVPGARIFGRAMPNDDDEDVPDFILRPDPLDDRVEIGEDGEYVVSQLSPHMWEFIVDVDGFALERKFVNLVWHDERETFELHAVASHPIQVVRASDRSPVEHALLVVYDDESWGKQLTTARTKKNGAAELRGLADGFYSVEVVYPGLAVTRTDVELPSDEPVVVELLAGATVKGTVIDRGGPPSEPLLIMLQRRDERSRGSDVPRLTVSDLDGAFRFADVEAGTIEISARERFQIGSLTSWWEPFAMTALAETEIEVEAGQEAEALLVVGGNLEGVETGSVRGRLLVNGSPAEGWKIRTWGRIRRSATTAVDGSFDMGRLAAGDVTLMIGTGNESMPGAAVDTYQIELAPDADEYLDIAMRTGLAQGRVVDAVNGQPIEGAQVTLSAAKSDGNWWGSRRSLAITGPDGRFLIEPVAEGEYIAEVEREGYARVSSNAFDVPAQGTARVPDLRLSTGLRVAGKLTLVGSTEQPDWMWLNATNDAGSRSSARPEAETMAYAFDDMAPGTWTVSIYTSDGVEYDPITIRVVGSTETQALDFQPAQPEEDDSEDDALEELGYIGTDDSDG